MKTFVIGYGIFLLLCIADVVLYRHGFHLSSVICGIVIGIFIGLFTAFAMIGKFLNKLIAFK